MLVSQAPAFLPDLEATPPEVAQALVKGLECPKMCPAWDIWGLGCLLYVLLTGRPLVHDLLGECCMAWHGPRASSVFHSSREALQVPQGHVGPPPKLSIISGC